MTQQEMQDAGLKTFEDFDSLSLPFVRKEVNQALKRILASDPFQRSERLTHFLSYVVEKTLQGQSADLKEYCIGVEVCGRKDTYDSRTDPVVRVEARRLRSAIDLYYANEGKDDAVQIQLPKGGYVPCFSFRNAADSPLDEIDPPALTPSLTRIVRWRWPLSIASGCSVSRGLSTK